MSVPLCQKTFVLFDLLNASPCLVKGFAFGVFGGTRIRFPHNSCDRSDRNYGLRGAEVLECRVTYK